MSFRRNNKQQISFGDSFGNLTEREKGFLKRSWASVFAETVFPAIDEEPFRVLYDTGYSRPNTPVNVLVGALILKELLGLSDDELLENLLLDIRFQYALHTTSFAEQPLSDRSLGRFRARCAKHADETGEDLIHACVSGISDRLASLMGISGRIRCMDSMMIAANIRRLGRLQLIYTCTADVLRAARKQDLEIPEALQHYLDPADHSRLFSHTASDRNAQLQETIVREAGQALQFSAEHDSLQEGRSLLKRCLEEQTVGTEDGNRRLASAEDGAMHSEILRNPADPDASCRKKAGKVHQGYVANMEESVGPAGSIIADYQLEKNTYSDSQFLKDRLEKMKTAEEPVTMITDGAYAGEENRKLVADRNVSLVTTDPAGRVPNPVSADFELSEDGTKILRCPSGFEPLKNGRVQKNGQFTTSFSREHCAECPHREACHAKIYKKVSRVVISQSSHRRAQYAKYMQTEEIRDYARLRNGVETVPSTLRRNHHADRMPVRGLIRSRIVFGCKVCACNIRKFMNSVLGRGNYAQNPLLTEDLQ